MEEKVEVRPARPEDKAAVLAFCEHTWEDDEDYIADVWDEWLADPNGRLFVALVNGEPVAIDRVAILSNHEAWWEGLRVHPDYRGQGLVAKMRPHLQQYIRESGVSVSRMVTSSRNTIVQGMAKRRGMQRLGRYALYKANPLAEPVERLQPLDPGEVPIVRRFLSDSGLFEWVHGLFVSRGWAWQELTDQILTTRAREGRMWAIKDGEQLAGLAVLSTPEGDEGEMWIGYVDSTLEGLSEILVELRRLAHRQGHGSVGGHFPTLPRVFEALSVAGYTRAMEAEMWVYQVPVSQMRL